MCYLVRHHPAETSGARATPPTGSEVSRPRWAAAGAVALMAGLAVAAFAPPAGTDSVPMAAQPAAAAPIVEAAAPVPAGTVVEQVTLGADDGVPSGGDLAKARSGHCHESL